MSTSFFFTGSTLAMRSAPHSAYGKTRLTIFAFEHASTRQRGLCPMIHQAKRADRQSSKRCPPVQLFLPQFIEYVALFFGQPCAIGERIGPAQRQDRKSTRLNSSHT